MKNNYLNNNQGFLSLLAYHTHMGHEWQVSFQSTLNTDCTVQVSDQSGPATDKLFLYDKLYRYDKNLCTGAQYWHCHQMVDIGINCK